MTSTWITLGLAIGVLISNIIQKGIDQYSSYKKQKNQNQHDLTLQQMKLNDRNRQNYNDKVNLNKQIFDDYIVQTALSIFNSSNTDKQISCYGKIISMVSLKTRQHLTFIQQSLSDEHFGTANSELQQYLPEIIEEKEKSLKALQQQNCK
ncbi:MAG TPA: hypothetical protein K8W06_04775 [Limosilactobacillus coleohominis]|nr:hypothetical protein [Limosilactobacillus coleohominis]